MVKYDIPLGHKNGTLIVQHLRFYVLTKDLENISSILGVWLLCFEAQSDIGRSGGPTDESDTPAYSLDSRPPNHHANSAQRASKEAAPPRSKLRNWVGLARP